MNPNFPDGNGYFHKYWCAICSKKGDRDGHTVGTWHIWHTLESRDLPSARSRWPIEVNKCPPETMFIKVTDGST